MKIILDAMGGDFAPEAPVMGAIDAAKAYGAQIVLVGRGEEILGVLKRTVSKICRKVWKSAMLTMWWTCTMILTR